MKLDADQIFKAVMDSGEAWADCKAAYCLLDDMTKTILADVTTDFKSSCPTKAEAADRALGSKIFKDHLAALSGARRAWLLAEVKYKAYGMLADLRRSEESTRRAEMGMR